MHLGRKYCYWSVCDGHYADLMERCVRSARKIGVFRHFNVFTDRPIGGCECFEAQQFDKSYGLFKLLYLKVGMIKLNVEWFIWLDADSIFVRNPDDVLAPLGRSSIHVPLDARIPPDGPDFEWGGVSAHRYAQIMTDEGVYNPVFLCHSAFWIIHHDAIEVVYDYAMDFWHKAKARGLAVGVSAALGYAMQLLCSNPDFHLRSQNPDLWGSDDQDYFRGRLPAGQPWQYELRGTGGSEIVNPCIVHLPKQRGEISTLSQPREPF